MKARLYKLAKNFVGALGHCTFEECELIIPALLIVAAMVCFSAVFCIAYEMIMDPGSADVSARLADLSIDSGKWI